MEFVDIQNQFMAHIRDPESNAAPDNIEDRRLNIYRELFFNNIKGFLSSGFPVIESILPEEQWNLLARRFFADHDCRAPYFVEISKEFVEYLGNEVPVDELWFPFLPELAHYEWLELDVSVRKSGELNLWDNNYSYNTIAVSPLAELVSYQWPVHQIAPDYLPDNISAEPNFFIVSRNSQNDVTFSQINQITAHLINLVSNSESIGLTALQEQIMLALPQLPASQVKDATNKIVEQMLSQEIFILND